jgi:molybdopterin synthase catalytic subunit
MITVKVQQAAFDVAAEMAALRHGRTDIGALVSFTGLVRDISEGNHVTRLTLEHHPVMTLKTLRDMANDASARWPLLGGTIIHRYGTLLPADDIVLVLIASAHRGAAFDAAHFLMDWLKTKAPFWKKEEDASGARWIEAKTSDDAAAARWQARPE